MKFDYFLTHTRTDAAEPYEQVYADGLEQLDALRPDGTEHRLVPRAPVHQPALLAGTAHQRGGRRTSHPSRQARHGGRHHTVLRPPARGGAGRAGRPAHAGASGHRLRPRRVQVRVRAARDDGAARRCAPAGGPRDHPSGVDGVGLLLLGHPLQVPRRDGRPAPVPAAVPAHVDRRAHAGQPAVRGRARHRHHDGAAASADQPPPGADAAPRRHLRGPGRGPATGAHEPRDLGVDQPGRDAAGCRAAAGVPHACSGTSTRTPRRRWTASRRPPRFPRATTSRQRS